ncbi:hypothetical protein FA13DRAFT_1735797 [Coprinellus micaceus]|uniref:Uncharacterized protein n=1 Tax=Coprinellus micaceus TaxID=71717 RepID=A0A4Y7T2E1_COPMI|nr:hypothetical protein FA13DRAFT_1735797 [Coprinellus micaceus]
MSAIQVYSSADRALAHILKQLCRALNPVKALRRGGNLPGASPGVLNTLSRRTHLQTSISVLDVAFSAAETIPVFGPTLKGALEAFCKVLTLIERLDALFEAISILGQPDPRLKTLVEKLHAIADKLYCNVSKKGVRVHAVAKALADSGAQVDRCLMDFNIGAQLSIMAALRVSEDRIALDSVTVMDPFGRAQPMFRVDMCDLNLVARTILSRYRSDAMKQVALSAFITVGLYELTMDNGHHIKSLSNSDGSKLSLSRGATVVMNVVILKVIADQEELQCPMCRTPMRCSEGDDIVLCMTCDRRVSAVRSKDPTSDAEKQMQQFDTAESLFRNILIRNTSTSRVEELPDIDESSLVGSDAGSGPKSAGNTGRKEPTSANSGIQSPHHYDPGYDHESGYSLGRPADRKWVLGLTNSSGAFGGKLNYQPLPNFYPRGRRLEYA